MALLAVLAWAAPAGAHQPVFVDSTTVGAQPATPTLDDGTVSFAVYGTLDRPDATAEVDARYRAGDPLTAELLVPDLTPEHDLPTDELPHVVITAPDGTTTELRTTIREPFAEPITATNYLRLGRVSSTAAEGTYRFIVTGPAPSRFTLAIGTQEVPGTVTGYTAPPAGALEAWYATPPPDAATLGLEPSTTAPDPTIPDQGGNVQAARDLDTKRMEGPFVDDARPGRAAGLPLAIAALIIMIVAVTVILRARKARSVAAGPPPRRDPSD